VRGLGAEFEQAGEELQELDFPCFVPSPFTRSSYFAKKKIPYKKGLLEKSILPAPL
jgi:lipoate synthase